MIACVFRLIEDENQNGWYGFALAQNMQDLFWQIDEHCDPNSVEIKKINAASICFKANMEILDELDDGETLKGLMIDRSHDDPIEISEDIISMAEDNKGWIIPKWPDMFKRT